MFCKSLQKGKGSRNQRSEEREVKEKRPPEKKENKLSHIGLSNFTFNAMII